MDSMLQRQDPEVWQAIECEKSRQRGGLELIASENYTSRAVMEAAGSVLTNKYAEGYPNKRYYGGCEHADTIEQLAIDRAKSLFGAEHANVQPHSGSQANAAVYFAALAAGDTILSMDLAHGGHLTHGMRLNFSGKFYRIIHYGVRRDDERIDLDQVSALAEQERPKLLLAGASAYPRTLPFAELAEIARRVGAYFMVDMAHIAGLVAGGLHPSPVPVCDFVTSTTHKTLRGPRAGFILCRAAWAAPINSAVFPGLQGGPLMHVVAGKAVCFAEAAAPAFRSYAAATVANAQCLGERLAARGYRVVSGGTDNHLLLVDVSVRGLGGRLAEKALGAAGITVNKNMIPFDARKPVDPSGVRIGTPAVTTRGMGLDEIRRLADWIGDVLEHPEDAAVLGKVRNQVEELCAQFPVPADVVVG